MKRRFVIPLLLVAGAALVFLASAAAWSWYTLMQPFEGFEGPRRRVVIEPGTGARTILEQLERERVLRSAELARIYLAWSMGDPHLKAGEYLFRSGLNTPQVLQQVVAGEVVTHPVTLVEGLTLRETALALSEAGFGPAETFIDIMSSPELIADLDTEATNLEGYLFPETYSFARDTAARDIVSTLVRTFRERFHNRVAPHLGPVAQGSVRDLVTLASIVEKEAMLDEERPLIAGVFRNRLERGQRLEADPTIIYALKLEGRWNGNLRRGDLQLDSPYNTYLVTGLPPSPICSPGLASLLASARPANVDYLYFVSRNDGSHVFSETLAEHNRNVERWQRRYWRERWARERAPEPD